MTSQDLGLSDPKVQALSRTLYNLLAKIDYFYRVLSTRMRPACTRAVYLFRMCFTSLAMGLQACTETSPQARDGLVPGMSTTGISTSCSSY